MRGREEILKADLRNYTVVEGYPGEFDRLILEVLLDIRDLLIDRNTEKDTVQEATMATEATCSGGIKN